MKRRWNLLPAGGFLVVLAAFLSYFFVFAAFPVTRDFPWVNLLLFLGGFFMIGLGLKRAFGRPEQYRGRIGGPVFTALSLAIFGFFIFYTFSFSAQLPASATAPKMGEKAHDFTLPDQDGKPVRLASLLADPAAGRPGQWVLLVFYRGYW
jgi:hypothetical protein